MKIIKGNFCFLTSGDVVTMECVEKLLKKDWINPLDNSKISEADIIPLQRVIFITIIYNNLFLHFSLRLKNE